MVLNSGSKKLRIHLKNNTFPENTPIIFLSYISSILKKQENLLEFLNRKGGVIPQISRFLKAIYPR